MVAEEFYKVQLGSKIEAIRTKTNEEGEMRIALRLRLSMNSSGFKEGRAFGRGNSMSKCPDVTDELGERQVTWSVRVCAGVCQRWSWEMGAGPRVQGGRVLWGVSGKLAVLESNREP